MGQGQEKKSPSWASEGREETQGTDTFTYAHIYFQLYDEDNKNIGNADKYTFDVRRYKDIATKEEYLNIKVYEVGVDDICAEIERANVIELESKLLNLRIYGVLLDRKHFPKVRQLIEKIYSGLSPRPVDNSTLLTSKVVNAIYEMFVRYIKEIPIEEKVVCIIFLLTNLRNILPIQNTASTNIQKFVKN